MLVGEKRAQHPQAPRTSHIGVSKNARDLLFWREAHKDFAHSCRYIESAGLMNAICWQCAAWPWGTQTSRMPLRMVWRLRTWWPSRFAWQPSTLPRLPLSRTRDFLSKISDILQLFDYLRLGKNHCIGLARCARRHDHIVLLRFVYSGGFPSEQQPKKIAMLTRRLRGNQPGQPTPHM